MSKENLWVGMEQENLPAASVKAAEVEAAMRKKEEHYHGPVTMRFEWEGRIYEGTAYYMRDVKEQENHDVGTLSLQDRSF